MSLSVCLCLWHVCVYVTHPSPLAHQQTLSKFIFLTVDEVVTYAFLNKTENMLVNMVQLSKTAESNMILKKAAYSHRLIIIHGPALL